MFRYATQITCLIFFVLFGVQVKASAAFFQDCSIAFETRQFENLNTFYKDRLELSKPDQCFSLNKNEFLITITDAGYLDQGLYYYDAKANSYDLVNGMALPNIAIVKEFLDTNKKRYVLISTGRAHRGHLTLAYQVLYLVPRRNNRSFVVKDLLFSDEKPGGGLCEGDGADIPITTSISAYQIFNNTKPNMRIEFAVTEEDCDTRKRRSYKRVFQPSGLDFVEIKKIGN